MNVRRGIGSPASRLLRVVLCVALLACAFTAQAGERLTLDFNLDWRFVREDPAGASAVAFEDAAWSLVSTPHTFNDTDTFDDWSLSAHRGEQNQWSGRTWYRKTFSLPPTARGRKVFIEFEAVRQIAEVYLNGHLLGVCKTGFTPFGFDLTPHLRFDALNVLAVMCDNRFVHDPEPAPRAANSGRSVATGNLRGHQQALNERIPERLEDLQGGQIPWNNPHWHPAHGGIYRNVRLHIVDPLHITLPLFSFLETVGPYVYATDISRDSAHLNIEIPVRNDRTTPERVVARACVFDANGNTALVLENTQTLAARATTTFHLTGDLLAPLPWEPQFPHVYRVACAIAIDETVVDTCDVPFGVRVAQWHPDRGLRLNGRPYKLHGWGQKPTDEWPAVGAAHPDWMHAFTLELMREAGGNFVRWGHCSGGPASIASGDLLGLVAVQPGVDGESDTRGAAWQLRVAAFRDVIVYFRNHPSILIWEGGNQKLSREHAAELRGLMDRYDAHGGRAYAHRRADQITAEFMDVGIGTEGGREIAHLAVVEGEYNREESPRRVWDDFSPPNFGYPEAAGQTYQLTSEQFAVNQVGPQWIKKLTAPEHAGGANWIFSDSTSGGRVATEVARASGEVDGMRLPKEAYYACAVMFTADAPGGLSQPRVHIIGHWTYPPGTRKSIYVVANAEEVELRLNDRPLGRARATERFLFTFPDVAWEPGAITAMGYDATGHLVAAQTKRTAGAPTALRLSARMGPGGLRADGADVVLVDVEAIDAAGERCPTFQQRVDFTLEGPGIWRGGYNSGKPDSINRPFLDLEAGINRVAIRATRESGTIALRATAAGLAADEIAIDSRTVEVAQGVAVLNSIPPESIAIHTDVGRLYVGDTASDAGDATASLEKRAGRFIRTFSYTAPSAPIAHVETRARDGRNAYVDIDSPFTALPSVLHGADWIQAGNRDSAYSAVDLIEIAVLAGATVFVAHDDGLPRPAWLQAQFASSGERIKLLGRAMSVFVLAVKADESLTLGSNLESGGDAAANMYVVFVNDAS